MICAFSKLELNASVSTRVSYTKVGNFNREVVWNYQIGVSPVQALESRIAQIKDEQNHKLQLIPVQATY